MWWRGVSKDFTASFYIRIVAFLAFSYGVIALCDGAADEFKTCTDNKDQSKYSRTFGQEKKLDALLK